MTFVPSRIAPLSRAATALTACLLVGAAASAHAAGSATAPSVRVSYQDLNLGTEAGSAALYGRIVAAAHKVCAVSDIRDLAEFAAAEVCVERAIASAVREVNSPRLAATSAARLRHGQS